MAVKVYRQQMRNYLGLSSDTKPTDDVNAGAMFFETDTGANYVYDGDSWELYGTSGPVRVAVSAASNGDNTLVAAQGAGNAIRVMGLMLVAAAAVDVRLESGAGGTPLTGVISLDAKAGFVWPMSDIGWVQTADNALLNLELSAAVQVSGNLVYGVV
ncbi:MAG: hypothetical protein AB7N65_17710 [Vicinamibacterales bacterium]